MSERMHKLNCNEYHQHHAPNCCAGDCWCHAAPVPDAVRAEYLRVRDAALEAAFNDLWDDAREILDAFILPLLAQPAAQQDALRAALESIAANTCCEGCGEAARVARAALAEGREQET